MNYKYKNPALVIILSIITCGIYYLYMIYSISNDAQELERNSNNSYPDGISPAVELILSLFTCGLYTIYWAYKYSKSIYRAQLSIGVPNPSDMSIVNVILIFFFAPATVAILQEELNRIFLFVPPQQNRFN